MPAEHDLAQLHHVSRNVVREAYGLLQSEGLIERVQGAGTFVLTRKVAFRFDRIEQAPPWGSPHRVILARRPVLAAGLIASELALPEGTTVMMVERVTIRVGERWALWTSYFPPEVLARAEAAMADLNDAYQLVAAVSDPPSGRASVSLEVSRCDGDIAETLEVPMGAPLLLMQRTLYADDAPIEFSFTCVRADRMSLAMEHLAVPSSEHMIPRMDIVISS